MSNEIKLLSGNSHPMLARLVGDRYAPSTPARLCHFEAGTMLKTPRLTSPLLRLGIEIAKTMSKSHAT